MKTVSSSLKLDLAQYHEMLTFAQFGSDLDASTKKILDHGGMLTELLKQPQYQPMSMTDQVLSLFAAKYGNFDSIPIEEVSSFEKTLHRTLHSEFPEVCAEIEEKGILSDELIAKMKEGIGKAVEQFTLVKGVK